MSTRLSKNEAKEGELENQPFVPLVESARPDLPATEHIRDGRNPFKPSMKIWEDTDFSM
jgi:hypothetical protein